MSTNCISNSTNSRITQLFSQDVAVSSARVDENGHLLLTRSDGLIIDAGITGSCCTLASNNYALRTIQTNNSSDDVLIGFAVDLIGPGTLQTTEITPTDTTVTLTAAGADITVTINNINYIEFYTKPTSTILDSLNCTSTVQCASNLAMEKSLRNILGTDPAFPFSIPGDLFISTTGLYSPITAIYGICNGILWFEANDSGTAFYYAIPLCNINYISYTPV